MIYNARFVTGALALAFFAGCVEDTGSSGPPFIESFDSSVSSAAVASCRNALDAQTNGAVRVVGSEFSQAASAIYMRVGANGAPWRCLVSNDGRNPSLMFVGSEGAL